ncbi:helix-turn-helix domain-containing protein [Salsuginibacillus kocurii]|uniref:helix-turn-helix domain-containing protein n=1 Tax=Salsuginibacillus kocurii TaxID=427078 RepID=UPI0003730B39|nr:helix-turn-helix transcriptional regulator [Salsuginibacillus kocurii]
MIKTEAAYQKALKRLREDKDMIEKQKQTLEEMKLTSEQVERALAPSISFHEQLKEEVVYYERIKRGEFDPIINLHELGKMLIAYRIYIGLTQQELANRLDVSAAQVSRDERNEYYGATLERLQQVMEALQMTSKTEIQTEELLLS